MLQKKIPIWSNTNVTTALLRLEPLDCTLSLIRSSSTQWKISNPLHIQHFALRTILLIFTWPYH